MKSYGITLFITIFTTLLLMVLKFNSWTALSFINASTFTSLILIVIGAFLFVTGKGFFSGIAYSFKRFFKKTSKSWISFGEPEETYTVNTHSFSLTGPFLIIGISLFVLITILSFVFF